MENAPAEQGRGVDCRFANDSASYTRQTQKGNVIAVPFGVTDRVTVRYDHIWLQYAVDVARADPQQILPEHRQQWRREYSDARELGEQMARRYELPLFDLTKGGRA